MHPSAVRYKLESLAFSDYDLFKALTFISYLILLTLSGYPLFLIHLLIFGCLTIEYHTIV